MWYRFDPVTKFYLGATEGQASPLEPGITLKPAHSTKVKPPDTWDEGKLPRWDGQVWEVVDIPKSRAEQVAEDAQADKDPVATPTDTEKISGAAGYILQEMSKAKDENEMLLILVAKIAEVTGG